MKPDSQLLFTGAFVILMGLMAWSIGPFGADVLLVAGPGLVLLAYVLPWLDVRGEDDD